MPKQQLDVLNHSARPSASERLLAFWRNLKFMGWKRLVLLCISLGAGIGLCIVGCAMAITWYLNRPIPAKQWPVIEIPAVGIKARLKTDWKDSARYQLRVVPFSAELAEPFDSSVRSNGSIGFTIILYDKSGFQLCSTEVTPSHIVDSSDRVTELVANDHLICSRSDYVNAERWRMQWVFPKLSVSTPAAVSPATPSGPTGLKASKKPATVTDAPRAKPAGGNDSPASVAQDGHETLTGFDSSSGNLETKSGKTFVVYRTGERTTAYMWYLDTAIAGQQPRLRVKCDATGECLIENLKNNQAVHAKPLK